MEVAIGSVEQLWGPPEERRHSRGFRMELKNTK